MSEKKIFFFPDVFFWFASKWRFGLASERHGRGRMPAQSKFLRVPLIKYPGKLPAVVLMIYEAMLDHNTWFETMYYGQSTQIKERVKAHGRAYWSKKATRFDKALKPKVFRRVRWYIRWMKSFLTRDERWVTSLRHHAIVVGVALYCMDQREFLEIDKNWDPRTRRSLYNDRHGNQPGDVEYYIKRTYRKLIKKENIKRQDLRRQQLM